MTGGCPVGKKGLTVGIVKICICFPKWCIIYIVASASGRGGRLVTEKYGAA
jgi:hypothetical protein